MANWPVQNTANEQPGKLAAVKNESETILGAGASVAQPRVPGAVAPGAPMQYTIVPEGASLVALSDLYPEKPRRIAEAVSLDNAADFARFFTDYRRPASVIFFEEEVQEFTAVFDYHERKDGAAPAADWCDHTATYTAAFSPEWQTWTGMDKKPFGQVAFAEFIEDNLPDIVEPASADLLEIVRTFEAKKDVAYSSAIRLNNGSVKMAFDEVVRGTANTQAGSVEIPEQFTLQMQVLRGGSYYKFPVRLKFRLKDRALVIWYEIIRPHKILERALDETVALIEEKTGLSVFRGGIEE